MSEKRIEDSIDRLLPDRGPTMNSSLSSIRGKAVKDAAKAHEQKIVKSNVSAVKQREKAKLKKYEKELQDFEDVMGREFCEDSEQYKKVLDQRDLIAQLEAIDDQDEYRPIVNIDNKGYIDEQQAARMIPLQSTTTRKDVVKLLTSLNINLNLQLTKQDTQNLLSCLLTCNEQQLKAIYTNNKVPVAIKIVIKRLQDDLKIGNMDTVEKLWDRIFGKQNMMLELPQQQQQMTGIVPNVPVSREAYVIIRDTIIGNNQ